MRFARPATPPRGELQREHQLFDPLVFRPGMAVTRCPTVDVAFAPEKPDMIRVAQLSGRLCKRVQHPLQVEGRAADDLEHVGGGSLLLQRFAQFIQQASVLDGNHCLFGKITQKLDLLVDKGVNLLTVNVNHADQFVFFKHGDGEYRPKAAKLHGGNDMRIACTISRTFHRVGDVNYLLCQCHAAKCGIRPGAYRSAPTLLHERGRCIMKCGRAKRLSLAKIQKAKLSLANPRRVLEHRLEDRLQVTW
jgi:hypothetical protein